MNIFGFVQCIYMNFACNFYYIVLLACVYLLVPHAYCTNVANNRQWFIVSYDSANKQEHYIKPLY